ncbi:MAG: chemotaxis protein CheX [Terracidiphilus sp.]|nr:chemotaxis protein CheX [Terracidiphilus sp.]
MRAQVDEECVIKANSQFWEQMLAMTLEPLPVTEKFCVDAGHILGSVDLSGVWKGRIEVRLGEGLAYSAAAAMLMQPVETVGEADTLDAIKEIANMIAGVIKSSLPRPCAMTVPASAVEAQGYCCPPRTEDTLSVIFRHTAGDLMVRVWEQECLE